MRLLGTAYKYNPIAHTFHSPQLNSLYSTFVSEHCHSFSKHLRFSNTLVFQTHSLLYIRFVQPTPFKMHFSSTIVFAAALLAPIVTADIHWSGLCINSVGGQYVYNDVATKAACAAYAKRNTGTKQFDTCPDCAMVSIIEGERQDATWANSSSKLWEDFLLATHLTSILEVMS